MLTVSRSSSTERGAMVEIKAWNRPESSLSQLPCYMQWHPDMALLELDSYRLVHVMVIGTCSEFLYLLWAFLKWNGGVYVERPGATGDNYISKKTFFWWTECFFGRTLRLNPGSWPFLCCTEVAGGGGVRAKANNFYTRDRGFTSRSPHVVRLWLLKHLVRVRERLRLQVYVEFSFFQYSKTTVIP